ncbi:hypothetical protein [Brachybacterium nesterenkovii]|uniref:hypothetical protein n=1 Tax=Brachybacterium nesterenkovii TaxID=47847 RepID=UPI0032190CFD
MNLRDTNLRYAALKLIADAVKEAMEDEKAGHLAALQASVEDTGARSWTVTIGGEKVATLNLAQRSAGVKITDEAALVAAVEQVHPDMIESRLKPWAAKQLLDSIVDVTDDGGVTRDGEVLPGISETPAGAPYQSLRWEKAGGRELVADAIRSGDLAALLADTGLPMIGGAA